MFQNISAIDLWDQLMEQERPSMEEVWEMINRDEHIIDIGPTITRQNALCSNDFNVFHYNNMSWYQYIIFWIIRLLI